VGGYASSVQKKTSFPVTITVQVLVTYDTVSVFRHEEEHPEELCP